MRIRAHDSPSSRRRYSIPLFAASNIIAPVTLARGSGLPISRGSSSGRTVASFRSRAICASSATRRNRSKSGTSSRKGPLAAAALGTPLARSIQSRNTIETGQLVCSRKIRVSLEIGVRNRWIASPLSAGMRVMVGRFEPSRVASGKILEKGWKMFPAGFGVLKNGRASTPAASSY